MQRRDAALKAMRDHQISQRRACVLIGVDPKTVRRERPPDSPDIRKAMNDIASSRRCFGYRRIGMRRDLVADQVQRLSHLDTQRLGLIAARHSAAIIVRQDDDRHTLQGRIKYPLCADIEIRAVADRDRPCHPRS